MAFDAQKQYIFSTSDALRPLMSKAFGKTSHPVEEPDAIENSQGEWQTLTSQIQKPVPENRKYKSRGLNEVSEGEFWAFAWTTGAIWTTVTILAAIAIFGVSGALTAGVVIPSVVLVVLANFATAMVGIDALGNYQAKQKFKKDMNLYETTFHPDWMANINRKHARQMPEGTYNTFAVSVKCEGDQERIRLAEYKQSSKRRRMRILIDEPVDSNPYTAVARASELADMAEAMETKSWRQSIEAASKAQLAQERKQAEEQLALEQARELERQRIEQRQEEERLRDERRVALADMLGAQAVQKQ